MKALRLFVPIIVAILLFACQQEPKPGWPVFTNETKPWTRWWWMGSAVTEEGITQELEAFARAGLGGVEITPIYGAMGAEDNFIPFLSPRWMELLVHTLKEADRLGLGVDMATGTGWPFGGPWVTEADASKNINHKVYSLSGGQRIKEKIRFVQQPFLRAVGNQVYEVHQSFSTEKIQTQGTIKEPLMRLDPKDIDINKLQQPISANDNLQELALDQIQFKKELNPTLVVAYNAEGNIIHLTDKVSSDGELDWTAPSGKWKVYALFQGDHGKMVERAAPGGEGYVIDHFSADALNNYLAVFDSAFRKHDIQSLRSFFNDSYEVDDARGAADWTPTLLTEFRKRRGYPLEEHIPALLGHSNEEENERILYDYRLTIAELLQSSFTERWVEWAHDNGALVRNQAHGSPANILDLYSAVDIPEIEGVESTRIRMASSAGNVSGKRLISSESATWLNEHFESNLGDIKGALDKFMLNGVNHVFYHGTCYSPPGEQWPGNLFYAAVHLNQRNPLWRDFDALNMYVTRCQSLLQQSVSDNEVLLYFPFADLLTHRGNEMVEHVDGISTPMKGSAFDQATQQLMRNGTGFDYISDRQTLELSVDNDKRIVTSSGRSYQAIIIPRVKYMPLETLEAIRELGQRGATITFLGLVPSEYFPYSYAGYSNDPTVSARFDSAMAYIKRAAQQQSSISFVTALPAFKGSETLNTFGLAYTRRIGPTGRVIYMIRNEHEREFAGAITFSKTAKSVVLYNPMTGAIGKPKNFGEANAVEIDLHLQSGETVFAELYDTEVDCKDFPEYHPDGPEVPLNKGWSISFREGGPSLPASVSIDTLTGWQHLSSNAASFSGTAVYTVNFPKPTGEQPAFRLDLGKVHESAEVILNGTSLGKLIGPTYIIDIESDLFKANNVLEIVVTNLMANRIAHLDRTSVHWKKFYNINFPARLPSNRKGTLFDASSWSPRPSGLIGPVKLVPLVVPQLPY